MAIDLGDLTKLLNPLSILGIGGGPKHVPVPAYAPSSAAGSIDTQQLLRDRPDVLAEYNQESTRDAKSRQHLQELGIGNADQFAKMWYDRYGQGEGYTQAAPTPTTPTPTTPTGSTTPAPTPQQDQLSKTINDLLGLFNQQQSRAQQQEAARENARASVSSTLGSSATKLNSSILGTSIQDILSGQYDSSKTQLDRGLARGMFNDVGYQAGLSSLDKNKSVVQNKLSTTANDILSGYRKSYDDIRAEALAAANNYSGTGAFDLNEYKTRADEILAQAAANAPGALQGAIGSGPLFDLNAIRGDAGTAQGALNLNNLDVMDALAKRKQVAGVGRGLGSQGSF